MAFFQCGFHVIGSELLVAAATPAVVKIDTDLMPRSHFSVLPCECTTAISSVCFQIVFRCWEDSKDTQLHTALIPLILLRLRDRRNTFLYRTVLYRRLPADCFPSSPSLYYTALSFSPYPSFVFGSHSFAHTYILFIQCEYPTLIWCRWWRNYFGPANPWISSRVTFLFGGRSKTVRAVYTIQVPEPLHSIMRVYMKDRGWTIPLSFLYA